jgi:hypothetical protein
MLMATLLRLGSAGFKSEPTAAETRERESYTAWCDFFHGLDRDWYKDATPEERAAQGGTDGALRRLVDARHAARL